MVGPCGEATGAEDGIGGGSVGGPTDAGGLGLVTWDAKAVGGPLLIGPPIDGEAGIPVVKGEDDAKGPGPGCLGAAAEGGGGLDEPRKGGAMGLLEARCCGGGNVD